jgi:hypothetical protein
MSGKQLTQISIRSVDVSEYNQDKSRIKARKAPGK